MYGSYTAERFGIGQGSMPGVAASFFVRLSELRATRSRSVSRRNAPETDQPDKARESPCTFEDDEAVLTFEDGHNPLAMPRLAARGDLAGAGPLRHEMRQTTMTMRG